MPDNNVQALNISHDRPDDTLKEVQEKLTNEICVTGAVAPANINLASELTSRVSGYEEDKKIVAYLIAHSYKGVLQLGDWTLSDKAVAAELARACKPIAAKIRAFVLLGCSTAAHDGWAAMGVLWRAFRDQANHTVNVAGTTMPIGEPDFSTTGFTKPTLLRGYREGSRDPGPGEPSTIERAYRQWFASASTYRPLPNVGVLQNNLRADSEDAAAEDQRLCRRPGKWGILPIRPSQFIDILHRCDPEVRRVPGLLAIPDYELFAHLTNGIVWRMSVLLDGWFIRTYAAPDGDGVLLRVTPHLRDRMMGEFGRQLGEAR